MVAHGNLPIAARVTFASSHYVQGLLATITAAAPAVRRSFVQAVENRKYPPVAHQFADPGSVEIPAQAAVFLMDTAREPDVDMFLARVPGGNQ